MPFWARGCMSEPLAGKIWSFMYFCTATCRLIWVRTCGALLVKRALIEWILPSSLLNWNRTLRFESSNALYSACLGCY